MVELLQALIASLFPIQSPHRDQRGDGREQEEPGKNPSLNIPLQKTGEIATRASRIIEMTSIEM